jgi:hypothetical protein
MKQSIAPAVGLAVHVGLETLLLDAQMAGDMPDLIGYMTEDKAVARALADFSTHRSALALDTAEADAMAAPAAGFDAQLAAQAADLGVDIETIAELNAGHANRAREFEDWLWREQASLVEGIVRAYARRRLQPLLAEFEVLEVEREGSWLLAHREDDEEAGVYEGYDLVFMSRPDALLRSRADNSLYLLSYKTAASWDVRKARDAEHDAQGLSEGVEVEKRLARWWEWVRHRTLDHLSRDWTLELTAAEFAEMQAMPRSTRVYLEKLAAPPRILGIRYEYLLKGSRYEDKDLSARFGMKVWAQRSHLIRAYSTGGDGGDGGDGQWCWSYDFLKDDGSASKLYYKTWRPKAVWESMSTKQWIDMLDTATETMSAYDSTTGMEPRPVGWHSDAQAQGSTATHPLDGVFAAPLTVYRQDDQLRDWVEQTEAGERRVAEAVAEVDAAADEGDRRRLLNALFPMTRSACSYMFGSECAMARVCYGGDDIRRDPLGSGLFKRRVPNHTPEKAATDPPATCGK